MTNDQLRQALRELNGERRLGLAFVNVHSSNHALAALEVKNAMLIPAEADNLVKVTDGRSVFIIEAAHVAWLSIT